MTHQLSEQVISEIRLLTKVAQMNRSHLSLKDAVDLTSVELSKKEVEKAWSGDPALSSTYEVMGELFLEKGSNSNHEHLLQVMEVAQKRVRANEYITQANRFLSFCKNDHSKLLAVSGSTSYGSPLPNDDLDIFAITRRDSLWIFLTKSLILARVFRSLHKDIPRLCFSYAIDEAFANKQFALSNDPLFARDALTTIVIHGLDFYETLLVRNPWISKYFPRLYRQKTGKAEQSKAKNLDHPSSSRSFVNLLLLFTVGRYMRIKSSLLNRKHLSQHKTGSLFTLKIAKDCCIFESEGYLLLRDTYRELRRLTFSSSTVASETRLSGTTVGNV